MLQPCNILSSNGHTHEASVTKMPSNTNNALVSLTEDSSLLVIKTEEILLNDNEVICYGKIHVCKIRDVKSQAKNPKLKTYACEVLLVHSNSTYLAQLQEAVNQKKMTVDNVRNLQCTIVSAPHQSEEEDVEDDSSSGEEMQRANGAGDGKVPAGTQLRRSARPSKRKKPFGESSEDEKASKEKPITKVDEKKAKRPVSNASRLAILAAMQKSQPKDIDTITEKTGSTSTETQSHPGNFTQDTDSNAGPCSASTQVMMETLTTKQTKIAVEESIDAVLPDDVNATYPEVDETAETQSTNLPAGGASVSLVERRSSSAIVSSIAPTGAPESTKQSTIAPADPLVVSEEDGVVKGAFPINAELIAECHDKGRNNCQKFINLLMSGCFTRGYLCSHSRTDTTEKKNSKKKIPMPTDHLNHILGAARPLYGLQSGNKLESLPDKDIKKCISNKFNNHRILPNHH